MNTNDKLTCIVVDDEDSALTVMRVLIETHCPQLNILALVKDSREAIEIIKTQKPDIIFLDIEMPRLNGFQILEQITGQSFHLIFTTAYNQYAVKAFKYSAVDYLLKPIEVNELKDAVAKVNLQNQSERLANLKTNFIQNAVENSLHTIALPHGRGYLFQQVEEIIYCEASNTYSIFHLKNKPSLLITKAIGEIENTLEQNLFFRIHRQYLVNKKEIKELSRTDGGSVTMSNGHQLPIARNRKEALLSFMGL